jgi:S1-C subfamily serine protease
MSTSIRELSDALSAVIAAAGPAVVGVGRSGSGVIVAQDRVLTNAHNIREKVEIHFADGTSAEARPAGVDIEGDLAVIDVPTGGKPTLALQRVDGPSAGPALGEIVVGLSLPRGRTLRAGVGFVTGKGISFQGPRGRLITGAMEHSAVLARGSSGGPLIDASGNLVGVNTHREGEGLYLALPATAELLTRVDALGRGEVPRRPRLGVALAPPRAARHLRQAVGLAPREGLLVQGVEEAGPADRAGIRRGDLIVSVGDRPTKTLEDLAEALETAGRAGAADIALVRGAEDLTVRVDWRESGSAGEGSPTEA